MKIIGITYHNQQEQLILKGDSSLLVNQKPFFIPDCTQQMQAFPTIALRVSRLGKNIAERFALRYIDAVAPAFDLQAADLLDKASQNGASWTTAVSLDNSFPVGNFTSLEEAKVITLKRNTETIIETDIHFPAQAIAYISRYITIRQGDIIYIPLTREPIKLLQEDRLEGQINHLENNLFCKIK